MGEIKLTSSQQTAVEDRDGALLVSAAAGSGKTRVLVERLLSRVCDENDPCNIDEFLVITYTNAAASELRVKITQAISERLAAQPENRHLQRQMNRVYLADISTVHSFCANLLRSYAYALELAPDFRVAEETEAKSLRTKTLEQLLERGYQEQTPEFLSMVEAFGYGRDDHRLADAVQMAYDAMRCRPDMERWRRETTAALDVSCVDDVGKTPWGAYVMEELHTFLREQIEAMRTCLDEMRRYPAIEKGYAKVFAENIRQLEQLADCQTWDALYEGRLTGFGRLGAVRNPESVPVKERVAAVRKRCWESLKKWQELIYGPSRTVLADLAATAPGTQALLRFVAEFDQAYSREKKRRKLLDFSDLEHLTIELLTDRYTGAPSRIAREISERYREILVDEYQDSNQVQEVIFEAISRQGSNRFMVGDVKQSIYRFRLADPTLFLRKYDAYPDAAEAVPGEPRKVLLSENFRSRPEILDACNAVFRLIMRKQVGDLDYGEAEALRPGRNMEALGEPAVELHCLTASEQEQDKRTLEADFVARRIRQMLDEGTEIADGENRRPVRPGDITILMRSVANNAAAYLDALRRRGVPAVCQRGGSLLDTTEVQLLVAMLQVIDNPHQDIPLLALLASPVFRYTPEELAQCRTKNRTDDYYDVMLENPERFHRFLPVLEQLREEAAWMSLHELIDSILRRTDMMAVFSSMTDGIQRQKNLMAFRSAAVSYEANGSRALCRFLEELRQLQEGGGQLPVPQSTAENAVTILSIHKSKGLEYPVVFLCDLSRQFNTQDLREAILVDDQLAVGCNRVDRDSFVRYPTLAKKSIERKKKKEAISEELRILYVAMTRPKDRLVMTYYSKNLEKELQTLNSQLTMPLSDTVCASVNNPGKWLLLTALCRTEAGELFKLAGDNDVSSVSEIPWRIRVHDLTAAQEGGAFEPCQPDVSETTPAPEVTAALQYDYPHRAASLLPAKITATQLKGRMQDQEAAEGAVELRQRTSVSFRKPRFLERGLTPAEKGTATHLFLQFAEYHRCTTEAGIEEELHRLRLYEFLTPEQAEAVSIPQIEALFRSALGQWLLSVPRLTREFKFSILVDAGRFSPQTEGEKVMLQGVVDCFVCEEDGITLVDFKTDRVQDDLPHYAERYRPQLDAYGEALSRIYQRPVKRKLLYFFSTAQTVEL